MPLSDSQAVELAYELREYLDERKSKWLDEVHTYLRDPRERIIEGLPADTPPQVKQLARMSRVNLLTLIVSTRLQGLYIDGFKTPRSPENVGAWHVWQHNKLDSRQIGINRAALSYGESYSVVLPGNPVPMIRGASPRDMSVGLPAEGDDYDFPSVTLWYRGRRRLLLDHTHVYELAENDKQEFSVVDVWPHGATWQGEPVCPVIRHRETEDLDEQPRGIVAPHIPLQDQINITTFSLQVAQHYGAFKQRYIIGMTSKNESQAIRMGGSRMMQIEEEPEDIRVGEFGQYDIRPTIESREASIRHLATVSQTPVHELSGEMINLSAEALEAIRASHHAAVNANRMVLGESYEQLLGLAGEMQGTPVDDEATVIWRDTRITSMYEAARALRELSEGLQIPPRALWPRVPDVPQHELETWQAMYDEIDDIEQLTDLLDRQATPPPSPPVGEAA